MKSDISACFHVLRGGDRIKYLINIALELISTGGIYHKLICKLNVMIASHLRGFTAKTENMIKLDNILFFSPICYIFVCFFFFVAQLNFSCSFLS